MENAPNKQLTLFKVCTLSHAGSHWAGTMSSYVVTGQGREPRTGKCFQREKPPSSSTQLLLQFTVRIVLFYH